LAYSSIAHGGYLLIGVAVALSQTSSGSLAGNAAVATVSGLGSALFYVAVYTFATLGTFAALTSLSTEEQPAETLDDIAGLNKTQPLAALALAVFMFSLAGIPPLAGFWGKFYLLFGAVQAANIAEGAAQWNPWFLVLAVVGALNAAVAAAYYLRLIATMYFGEVKRTLHGSGNPGPIMAGVICVVLVIGTGLFAGPLLTRTTQAAQSVQPVPHVASAK
jgi:NADH-quinone oxidoreductase subunit N